MEEKKVIKEGSTPDKMGAELEALKAQVADLQKVNNKVAAENASLHAGQIQLEKANKQLQEIAQRAIAERDVLRNVVKDLSRLL